MNNATKAKMDLKNILSKLPKNEGRHPFPLGYFYLQRPSAKKIFSRNSESSYHSSSKFSVGEFYKPISLILISDDGF